MPVSLTPPSPVVSRARHCTGLLFALPIAGELSCVASFTVRETREDGTTADVPAGDVTLTQAEIAALPAFRDSYEQLSAAVHAKRDAYAT
jgi:hypothetical protein